MRPLDALPDRPLEQPELDALREGDGVVEVAPLAKAGDEIRHLALQNGETLYGLGYRDEDGWHVVTSREARDPEDLRAVRDALKEWAEEATDLPEEPSRDDAEH